mgnify:CR=1 FL=1
MQHKSDAQPKPRAPHEGAVQEPRLQALDLACGYDGAPVIEQVNFSLAPGEVCCILGPNGVGKTTLFKTLLGVLPALGGQVLIDGQDAAQMSRQHIARKVGYVPQAHTPPFPFVVADVVKMGRTPYINTLARITDEDRRGVADALALLGIADIAQDTYTELSGGQQQLVLIARALAQQPEVLVMDEPTSALSIQEIEHLYTIIRGLKAKGVAIIYVSHKLDEIYAVTDRITVMRDGKKIGELMEEFGALETDSDYCYLYDPEDQTLLDASFQKVPLSVDSGEIVLVEPLYGDWSRPGYCPLLVRTDTDDLYVFGNSGKRLAKLQDVLYETWDSDEERKRELKLWIPKRA